MLREYERLLLFLVNWAYVLEPLAGLLLTFVDVQARYEFATGRNIVIRRVFPKRFTVCVSYPT
jgi:hypothetical protein